ncbi:MAG TPA: DUF4157 domain-containing protein [Pyrinomonadaceae bacterium]|nr:DUF4157 domain-containing protein [Pyrinomonadaceae bacterium]
MTSLAGVQTGKTQPARSNPGSLPLVQRKCACGNSPGLTGQCEECEKEKLVQRSAGSESRQPSAAPEVAAQMQSMRNSGEPLNDELREFFEPRFGHDFSRVRIHTDARAADTSKALNARAYTVGRDVAFASGQYNPETSDGRQLLAHELTHVVQQENSSTAAHVATSTFNVAPADDPSEREADRVARDVCSGSAAPGIGSHHAVSSAHTVHRQPAATTPPAAPASGPVEGPCDADTQESLKSVRTDSQDMIQQARDRLNTLRGADLKQPDKDQQIALQALARNFAVKPDGVEKHLETIRDRLGNMQSFSENTSVSSFICSSGAGPCASKADAFTRRGDGRPVIGFCPTFLTLDPFQQKDTYVHELAHATDAAVKDQAYTSQRAYGTITTEVALVNADSYARLVTDLRDVTQGEQRFVTLGYTTHKDSLKDCGRFTETLTKAMAEAELANFAALRSLGEEELWKARGQILSQFNVVVRSPAGDCKRNDALANRYISVFNKADDLLSKSGFVLQCDATEDCKTGPASYDGKVMRICLSWDKAVSRFAYFGWPNAILQAIYAYLDGGVSFGPVAGAPKEYRGANAAAIASHMIAAQRTESAQAASGFCQSVAPLRPDEEKTTAAAAATRKRERLATGAVGWPVPELQEKLQRLAQPDLVVNGVFDEATQKALIKFQESEKLVKPAKSGPETTEPSIAERGVADAPTWTRLFTQLPGFHGMPKGETFKIVGFRKDDEITMLDFDQQLLPTTTNFKGLKVTELDPGGGVNTCCSGFGCRRSITGGTWPVRDDNLYGPDTVGFTLPQVERYQHGLRVSNSESCAYAIPQVMVAELPEGQFEFTRALQLYLINKKEVACAKLNQKDRRGASMTIPRKEK